MNVLEQQIRQIFEVAMVKVVQAIQLAPSGQVGTAFTSHVPTTRAPSQVASDRPSTPAPSQGKRGRKPRGKNIDRGELTSQVLEFISNSVGTVGAADISRAVGVDSIQLGPVLKKLRDEGKVIKHGDKRATTYGIGNADTAEPVVHVNTMGNVDEPAPSHAVIQDDEPDPVEQSVSDKLASLHADVVSGKKTSTNRYKRTEAAQ
jgi:hypothetical protein